MRFRHAALVAAGIAVLVASLVLAVRATGSPDLSIDDAELAAARAAHQRRQAARAPSPREPQPAPQPRPRTQRPEPEPEPEREPRREARPDRADRSRPSLATEEPEPEPEPEPASSGELEVDDVRAPFDRGRYLEALEYAVEYLERDPDQAYIRRIAVTSACATGDLETAQKYYDMMDERDQRTSERRCARWNVDFEPL